MKKDTSITELAFIIILAFLLSATLYFVLAFALSMFDAFDDTARIYLNSVTSTLAGLIIGFKLRELMAPAPRAKTAPKKKARR